jgi:hypothetical protein
MSLSGGRKKAHEKKQTLGTGTEVVVELGTRVVLGSVARDMTEGGINHSPSLSFSLVQSAQQQPTKHSNNQQSTTLMCVNVDWE